MIVSGGGRKLQLRELFLKELGFDPVLPDPISLLLVLRPWRILAVDFYRAVAVEGVFFLRELLVLGDTLFDSLLESGKDLAGRAPNRRAGRYPRG